MGISSEALAPSSGTHESRASLEQYQEALGAFEANPDALLPVLIARDELDAELRRWAGSGPTAQPFDRNLYRRQLQLLREQIGRDHPNYSDLLLYEYRLYDIVDEAQRYGATDSLRAERARVMERLNNLTLSALGVPFTGLASRQEALAAAADDTSHQLVALDKRLRQLAFRREKALAKLPEWRSSLRPSQDVWWWSLDQQFETSEREKALPWQLLATVLMMISLTLTAEIIRRLWIGTPDLLAVFMTVLTLFLTGSPLLKRGPDLVPWVLRRIPWLSPRFHGSSMVGMAGLALALVLACWFSLPALGTLYNNMGDTALKAGHLTDAEQLFLRATALNPDLPVPYINLADVYEESGSPEEAINWYRKAIEHDRGFRAAYHQMGRLYNRQGDFAKAERILLAGLNITNTLEDETLARANKYMLLSHLGWTLFAQRRFERAHEVLQQALQIEGDLDAHNRQMLPHYYLARVYCQLQRPTDAVREIGETRRFGDPKRWEYQLWNATVEDYLQAVEAGADACETIPQLHEM